ncbi:cytochrome c oxidase subunit 1 [Gryganskiella cystojenkinii]|nr:cytochrome c oxidase subunit 1 [Gryganskiella cystojenkinii]
MAPAGGGSMSFSDRFFSYETFKVLRVRDRRLGGLYRLFQTTILIYIASSIIIQQRYLKTENVIDGAVRVTLKAPVDGIATPSYCKITNQTCLYWNENDILYEPGVDGALITTRTQITQYGPYVNQSLTSSDSNQPSPSSQCDVNIATIPGCDPYKAPSTLLLPTSLVADIERFTLMLEHSIRGQATGVQIRSGSMESGLLRDSVSGEVLKTFTDASRYVPAIKSVSSNATLSSTQTDGQGIHLAGDVMTVGEFLKAAGVNLDELSGSPTASGNETVRSSGVVVIVVIQYAAKGWNPNRISYEYLPKAIPDQEYKVIETIRDFKSGSRVEINRHGIRIVFSQAGQLGQFSFMTLLTNLVAAVALFKVANIVVELMMLRLHPQKKVYVRAKFESTKGSGLQGRKGGSNGKEVNLEITELDQDGHARPERLEQGVPNGSHWKSKSPHGGISNTSIQDTDTEEEGDDEDHDQRQGSDDSDEADQKGRRHTGGNSTSDSSDNDRENQPGSFCTGNTVTTDIQYNRRSPKNISRKHEPLSIQTGSSYLNSHANETSKASSTCRPRTPLSKNGTLGQSLRSTEKRALYSGQLDWNRNGSSSALNSDVLPGVAKVVTRSAPRPTSRVTTVDGEEFEIETRYGPIRSQSSQGFNPGGLLLSPVPPTTPLQSTPPRSRIPFGVPVGLATPENRAGFRSPSYASQVSPASMQAVSPSPVCFGPESDSPKKAESSNRDTSRVRGRGSRKQGMSFAIGSSRPSTMPLRRSSCSSMSLTSSSSNSSLCSLYEECLQAKGLGHESNQKLIMSEQSSTLESGLVLRDSQKKRRKEHHHSSGTDSKQALDQYAALTLTLDDKSNHGATSARRLDKGKSTVPSHTISAWTIPLSSEQAPLASTATVDTRGKEVLSHFGSAELPPFLLPLPAFPSLDDTSFGSSSSSSPLVSSSSKQLHHMTTSMTQESSTSKPTAQRTVQGQGIFNSGVRSVSSVPLGRSASIRSHSSLDEAPRNKTSGYQRPQSPQVVDSCVRLLVSAESTSYCRGSSSSSSDIADSTHRQHHACLTAERPLDDAALPSTSITSQESVSPSVAISAGISSIGTDLGPSYTLQTASPVQLITQARIETLAVADIVESGVTAYTMPISTNGLSDAAYNLSHVYTPPTNAFFTSPITSACTSTIPGTGIRVLGRTIRMVTADNTELILCRSEPLILNEGVGEEKAARM